MIALTTGERSRAEANKEDLEGLFTDACVPSANILTPKLRSSTFSSGSQDFYLNQFRNAVNWSVSSIIPRDRSTRFTWEPTGVAHVGTTRRFCGDRGASTWDITGPGLAHSKPQKREDRKRQNVGKKGRRRVPSTEPRPIATPLPLAVANAYTRPTHCQDRAVR